MRRRGSSAGRLGLRSADGPAGRIPRLRRRLRGHAVLGDGSPAARGRPADRGGGDPGRRAGRRVRHGTPRRSCSPAGGHRVAGIDVAGARRGPGPGSLPATRGSSATFVTGDALDARPACRRPRARPSTPCSTSACSTSCSRTTDAATRPRSPPSCGPGGVGVRRGVERPQPVRDRAGAGHAGARSGTRSGRPTAGRVRIERCRDWRRCCRWAVSTPGSRGCGGADARSGRVRRRLRVAPSDRSQPVMRDRSTRRRA